MEYEAKLTVRLPASLHERLVELARRDRRSLNSEIVVLLERAAAEAERPAPGGQAPR
jgi:predicted HicB family RNase H-like nuclease